MFLLLVLLGDNRTIESLKKEEFDVGITEIMGGCGFAVFKVNSSIKKKVRQFCYDFAENRSRPRYWSLSSGTSGHNGRVLRCAQTTKLRSLSVS